MSGSDPVAGGARGDDPVTRHTRAQRDLEHGIEDDFGRNLSYGAYLDLPTLLSAQHPRATPPQHDELLFIIQHQTTELWLRLVIHELTSACELMGADDHRQALKRIARVKHIQASMTEQWSVLATLTPSEYARFRAFLATGSGFQSWQYRAVEFMLGNKNAGMLPVFAHDEAQHDELVRLLHRPSLYDEVLAWLARRGHAIPAEVLGRDVSQPYHSHPGVVEALGRVYADPQRFWAEYETAEELVDLEDNFQVWRFRHLKTVERIIGSKRGTGGSSGTPFLRRALDLTFFPELYDVRSAIQDVEPEGYHGGDGRG
ncbi:tryptophan 2,3-dioxygenase family protein [uncultured Serinicoccus sp.]|uniref:tryptophan 2,3-dioxygenase n=1 Tax=uncultured Serinicoccus sp. TaxID=735514 RepID=UPI002627A75D|nr:tryptophan 2,3-dioxygenase family protein [uncultured Serinicoccus sp.]